jgi:hypothetical protein
VNSKLQEHLASTTEGLDMLEPTVEPLNVSTSIKPLNASAFIHSFLASTIAPKFLRYFTILRISKTETCQTSSREQKKRHTEYLL